MDAIGRIMREIQEKLFSLADIKYKDFTASLIPTVDKETIIGVRSPALRQLAKELDQDQVQEFLDTLPHTYYEENNLHAFLIGRIKDYSQCIQRVEDFLPYIDNWATCDSLATPIFKKHLNQVKEKVYIWLEDDYEYTVRYAIGVLMRYYLDDAFDSIYLDWVQNIDKDTYYINMMRAWYFATALAKQEKATYPIFEKELLDVWTHNKAIQKCIESRRISNDLKQKLRVLKRKGHE